MPCSHWGLRPVVRRGLEGDPGRRAARLLPVGHHVQGRCADDRRIALPAGQCRRRPPSAGCRLGRSSTVTPMRTRLTVATVLLATVGMVGCASSSPGNSSVDISTGDSGNPGIAKGTEGTAVASSTLTTPQAVPGSDGKWHLAYELLLTNVAPFPLRIT